VAQIFQSGKADGNCITQIGFYAWYIVYPLIFFKTVKDDSDYHWNYASKPLIESTQQSIADLDLFSLPGYHGVHFESTEDKRFRFKKLKQLVSGYVPIIPFTKIKFRVCKFLVLSVYNTMCCFRWRSTFLVHIQCTLKFISKFRGICIVMYYQQNPCFRADSILLFGNYPIFFFGFASSSSKKIWMHCKGCVIKIGDVTINLNPMQSQKKNHSVCKLCG